MTEIIRLSPLPTPPTAAPRRPFPDKGASKSHLLRHYFSFLGRSLSLIAKAPLNSAHRLKVRAASLALGCTDSIGKLPRVTLESIVPTLPEGVNLREPIAADWNVSLFELVVMSAIVRHFRPAALFEIGTFDGRTTLNLAASAPPDSRTYTLDLPPGTWELPNGTVVGSRFANTDMAGRITQLFGFSNTSDLSAYFDKMDLIFVDADHNYQAVRDDSQLALKLLRKQRGIILWHDYATYHGPTLALDELYAAGGIWSGLRAITGTSLACLCTL